MPSRSAWASWATLARATRAVNSSVASGSVMACPSLRDSGASQFQAALPAAIDFIVEAWGDVEIVRRTQTGYPQGWASQREFTLDAEAIKSIKNALRDVEGWATAHMSALMLTEKGRPIVEQHDEPQ